jgi:HD-like signal output (HDOD) protein
MVNFETFFASVKLPSISEVAHALIQTMNNEDAPVSEVRSLISKDPALSAKLLRLANSAQFGLVRGVGTLDDAITMVGMTKVRTLALGACLSESFPRMPDLMQKEFWRSSMACAGYAQWMATRLGIDGQLAWLTGMMLRLGELLIAQANPSHLHEIEKLPHLPGGRWQREQQLLGFTEGHITAELARRWNFPMQIVQALQRSSEPMTDQAFSRLGAIIHLAGLLAEYPQRDAKVVDELPADVIAALHLDVDWLRNNFPDEASFMDVTSH